MIKYKHTFKQGYSFRSWIYQMARNLHADLYRDEKKTNNLFINSESLMSDVADEGVGFGEEDYKRLDHALLSLNPEQREILVLSRYQGLKYEEISAITRLSVPAIKVAVHRAVKQLRVIYFKQI
jgi:RNA polymerase sigma-70 factor (ECF subfamily)